MHGYPTFCEGHKNRVRCAKQLLAIFEPQRPNRLGDIVSGDETFISFCSTPPPPPPPPKKKKKKKKKKKRKKKEEEEEEKRKTRKKKRRRGKRWCGSVKPRTNLAVVLRSRFQSNKRFIDFYYFIFYCVLIIVLLLNS